MRKGSRYQTIGSFILCFAMLLAISPMSGAEGEGPSISDEIIKMLEAEMPEELILEWLDGAPVAAASLSADEMVALKRAGASTDLLRALLEWSRRSTPSIEQISPVVSTKPAETRSAPPATPSPTPSVAVTGPNNRVSVHFEVSYLARFEDPDPEFDMFVYVDGVPVTYITNNEIETRANRMEFSIYMPPGEHVLRVTQERHFKSLGGKRWSHETRVAQEDFPFDLTAGQPASLTVEFAERLMEWHDPLSFGVSQGERVVDKGPLGAEAEFWPLLCEDIEASVPEGKKPGRNRRKQLETCIRWDSLWHNSDAPDRQDVLEVMAGFDFQPVPKGS